MNKRPLIFCLFICVPALTLLSCGKTTTPWGAAFNAERRKRSIPELDSTWIARDRGDQLDWANPAFQNSATTHNKMHTYKWLELDSSGKPVVESDYYHSGKMGHPSGADPGEMMDEELTITYDFREAAAGKNPWSCHINCGDLERLKLNLGEAEQILLDWGLPRL